ncbi:MAG: ribbon-helix-helix protein, CopG family [Bacteroidetes bacterium]|jgi:predicted transcriptional regulator|nr:ribbon-helix-helix protein, CopG family [Bacteroidota bacterium]
MSTTKSTALSIRLPESLRREVEKLAKEDGVSVNQFIAMAVAEKTAALRTVDYLKQRAERGSREAFERVLANVPDVEPPEYDKL